MEKLTSELVIDSTCNRGVDLTLRGGKIIHVDHLTPEDWGDYQWELMD